MPTIVMTGGTSGIGEVAVKRMMQSPDARILLGARRTGPAGIETLHLDLSKLAAVRSFASRVHEKLGKTKINALVFNAGIQFPNDETRTPDGFETTFAVNHLAHYLLVRLLLPILAQGARIVLTTSGTHDPAEKTIIVPPRHADAKLLAHPELDPERERNPLKAGGRAYSSSKLCTILTVHTLAANPETASRGLTVLAYDPGPTPGTGLVRNSSSTIRFFWSILETPLFRTLFSGMNSREAAGDALADLALGKAQPPADRIYAALRGDRLTWPDPSEMARRDDLAEALWRDSANLVGLPI